MQRNSDPNYVSAMGHHQMRRDPEWEAKERAQDLHWRRWYHQRAAPTPRHEGFSKEQRARDLQKRREMLAGLQATDDDDYDALLATHRTTQELGAAPDWGQHDALKKSATGQRLLGRGDYGIIPTDIKLDVGPPTARSAFSAINNAGIPANAPKINHGGEEWVQLLDPEEGATYWYCVATGAAQWETPTEDQHWTPKWTPKFQTDQSWTPKFQVGDFLNHPTHGLLKITEVIAKGDKVTRDWLEGKYGSTVAKEGLYKTYPYEREEWNGAYFDKHYYHPLSWETHNPIHKGGKRKSRRNLKGKKTRKGKSRKGKSRKNRRKSNRRRR